jgi:hypothetical protein
MNDNLYCKVFIDGAPTRERVIGVIAPHLDATRSGRTIVAKHLEIDVNDNDDFDERRSQREPDGFLYWRWFLDVEPVAGAARANYIRQLTHLILRLRWSQLRVVAACGFEDELPPNRPPRVICEVAGVPLDQGELAPRELGFGRREDLGRLLPWQARFEVQSFIGLADPLYRVLCDETRSEVAAGLEPDPISLVRAEFPGLPALIEEIPVMFEPVFVGYLALDFCQWWLGGHASPRVRYVVNGIDHATLSEDGSSVLLTGEAYEIVRG